MKKFAILLFALLAVNVANAATQQLGGIAATVNDEIITTSQLNKQVALAKKQMASQHIQLPTDKVLQKQVLDMMINQSLELQLAKRYGITATDKEVDDAITNIAQSQNTTKQVFIKAMNQQGMSTASFRQQLKDQLIMSKLQREIISPHINVSQAEIDTYIRSIKKQNNSTQYHIEDILISLPTAPTPDQISQALQRANTLIKKIKAGADFKTVAAAESSGQQALQGGDIGWHTLAELPAAFASVIQNLPMGGISAPVRANDGIHILSLAGVRSGSSAPTSTEQLHNDVANMLFKRKFEERLTVWQQQLRDTAYIDIK